MVITQQVRNNVDDMTSDDPASQNKTISTSSGAATTQDLNRDASTPILTAAPTGHQGGADAEQKNNTSAPEEEKTDVSAQNAIPAAEASQQPTREYLKGWRLYTLTFAYVTAPYPGGLQLLAV